MRLDTFLTENKIYESRTRSARAIKENCVKVNGKTITKASFEVNEDDKIEWKADPVPYVSRGAFKLEFGLDKANIDVEGLKAVDIGASTGGFTDCLLRRGAKKVFAIDSGTNQLHESLRGDSRVVVMENFNARALDAASLGEKVDIAVCDLSFISQKYVYKPVTEILKENGLFVSLIKPQFEAGREHLSKGGIVKDKKAHKRVIESLVNEAAGHRLYCVGVTISPIQGGDGNTEYLALFRFSESENIKLRSFEMPEGI